MNGQYFWKVEFIDACGYRSISVLVNPARKIELIKWLRKLPSEGFVMGLREAKELADELIAVAERGHDPCPVWQSVATFCWETHRNDWCAVRVEFETPWFVVI